MNLENYIIVIQSRMGSQRFPGKVTANFMGKPMLVYQIDFLRQHLGDTKLCIATPEDPKNKPIWNLCHEQKVEVFKGDELNVLSRYIEIAKSSGFDNLIRLTGDNPLFHPKILNACVAAHQDTDFDLTSNREISTDNKVTRYSAKGLSVDILRSSALKKIDTADTSEFDREHVIPRFYRHPFKAQVVKNLPKTPYENYSIDTPEDKEQLEKLLTTAGHEKLLGL